jgi:predicted DNA-binding mobile mystery protein A
MYRCKRTEFLLISLGNFFLRHPLVESNRNFESRSSLPSPSFIYRPRRSCERADEFAKGSLFSYICTIVIAKLFKDDLHGTIVSFIVGSVKSEFMGLRRVQLDRQLVSFPAGKSFSRPQKGWIRAIREAMGITGRELARRLGRVPSLVSALEKSEADYRISLSSLRAAAEALDCELVYALVPRSGTVDSIRSQRARAAASENVRAVEHSMALEDQAVGEVEGKIEEETRRILDPNLDK